MAHHERRPHPALRPFVDRLWTTSSGPSEPAQPARILPDGCIDIVVTIPDGEARVVGTMTRAISVEPRPGAMVGVRFKPGGASSFLGVAAHELTNAMVPIAEIAWRGQRPALGCTESAVSALAEVERWLLERVGGVSALEPHVAYAVRRLFGAKAPSVDHLARALGWSRQHFTRVFRHHVGIGPKELAGVARMQRAVDRVQREPKAALADTALGLGYFDQAHMCRDFQRLTGITPVAVRSSTGSIFPIRSLWCEA